MIKIRKAAKIRNRYDQDITWESDKNTVRHHKQEPRGNAFPAWLSHTHWYDTYGTGHFCILMELQVKIPKKLHIPVRPEDILSWQTVQTWMKCRLMRHFIWVFTVCQSTCLLVYGQIETVNHGYYQVSMYRILLKMRYSHIELKHCLCHQGIMEVQTCNKLWNQYNRMAAKAAIFETYFVFYSFSNRLVNQTEILCGHQHQVIW